MPGHNVGSSPSTSNATYTSWVVERKVAGFEVARLEALILEVASRELRAIEVLGGVLGFAVGLVQAAILVLM